MVSVSVVSVGEEGRVVSVRDSVGGIVGLSAISVVASEVEMVVVSVLSVLGVSVETSEVEMVVVSVVASVGA